MINLGNSEFDNYIAEEIQKYNGVSMPLKTGMLRRLLVTRVGCKRLHPNPNDEFSRPEIGPSYRIISDYEKKFLHYGCPSDFCVMGLDPIVVERMHPDGYMILNGHHRWAAAIRLGYIKIPIKIVNFTHEEDIKEILAHSVHDKRVTLDLDEVVFCPEGNEMTAQGEKALSFPFNRFYKERLRVGIPALFRFFEKNGYDIWVYSSKFYSTDYIKSLFNRYHVKVTGIVTGTEKRRNKEFRAKHDKLIKEKYKHTLHVDSDTVLKIYSKTGEFEEYDIESKNTWSKNVMDIVGAAK